MTRLAGGGAVAPRASRKEGGTVRVAWQTLRTRWVSFAGTIVALVLGVAQVAAMGLLLGALLDLPDRPPQRFAGAPAVVVATDPTWDPAKHDLGTRSLPEAKGVSPQTVSAIEATGPAVVDRAFYAQLAGGRSDGVGHAWSVARFGGYRLASGRAPASDSEIVVGGPTTMALGGRVTVLTAGDARQYTVVGRTNAVGYEHAVFFTDREAARISPRIEAVVPLGPLPAVRSAVADNSGVEVLTGDDRHLVDASRGTDREDLDNTVTLLPITASVAGSTAIFVVASTFAFAVAQRRREVALLRTAGATPRQVRRMVRAEALLVGAVGSAAGALLGLLGAAALAGWLNRLGISPPWFGVHASLRPSILLPLLGASAVGLLVAWLGALVASFRAGRIGPMEALRDAAVDRPNLAGRWATGAVAVAGGLGMAGYVAFGAPEMTLAPDTYVPTLLVPVLAAVLLTPTLAGPLTRLLMAAVGRLPGAGPMLIRQSALTSPRRTAATAVPVLITVALSISLLGATGTINDAHDDSVRDEIRASYALTPQGSPGINQAAVRRADQVPGVHVTAPVLTSVYTRDDDRIDQNDAYAVSPAGLADTVNLPVVAGSLSDLADDTVVIPESWGYDLGEPVQFLMADGTTATLRVAAVYEAPRGQDIGYLTQRYALTGAYARDGLARQAYLVLDPGTDPAKAIPAVRAAIRGLGADVVTTRQMADTATSAARHLTTVRQESVAVIVVLFCFIAILNTLLMATADRRRDLAVLRLAGATPRQVLIAFAGESLLVAAVGVVLGALASAVNLAGLWIALTGIFGGARVAAPLALIAGIAVVAALLAVLGTILPVSTLLRARAAALTGGRE